MYPVISNNIFYCLLGVMVQGEVVLTLVVKGVSCFLFTTILLISVLDVIVILLSFPVTLIYFSLKFAAHFVLLLWLLLLCMFCVRVLF